MLLFVIFSEGEVWGGKELPRPQMIVIKLNIKEMHFKNVNHWLHALYKKTLNTLKS